MMQKSGIEVSAASEELMFVKLPEVLKMSAMSRSAVYAAIKCGRFPPPVKLGERSVWVRSEIVGWMHSMMANRKVMSQ